MVKKTEKIKKRYYLGLNAYSHDSSACIIDEQGEIIAAAEEERFNQQKHYSLFPENAIKFCLKEAKISSKDLSGVAVGWSPGKLIFSRILKEYLFEHHPPRYVLVKSIKKTWRLLRIKKVFEEKIGTLPKGLKIEFFTHHLAHAASAFYASGFNDAAFLTIDARGEYDSSLWGTTDYLKGIQVKGAISHPQSIGCIWGAIGEYCGFLPGWKRAGVTMGFSAFGKPKYLGKLKKLIKFYPEKDNNWFEVNTDYFKISDCKGQPTERFEKFIGAPSAQPDNYKKIHQEVASSWQKYTEEIIIEKLKDIYKKTKKEKIVMAGGVCLNSVANGLILHNTPFKELFTQPASHDAGVAIGAAYLLQQKYDGQNKPKPMKNAFLGPSYSSTEIEKTLRENNNKIKFFRVKDVHNKIAQLLNKGKIVMWFQGRLEYGPRALGARSILAPVIEKDMQSKLNYIKKRESFRPFAISILEEDSKEWLVNGNKSPYMLLVDAIKPKFKNKVPSAQHVDGSVRVQTVNKEDNEIYYLLLKEYKRISGIPLFINTSFNIKGLPIVNDPKQALEAFLDSKDVKYLAIGEYLVTKIE